MALRRFLVAPLLFGTVWCLSSSQPQRNEELSTPKLWGHTSNVAPHNPNRDREWYTEARWDKGDAYEPQDGAITVLPKHVAPPPAPAPKSGGAAGGMLNGRDGSGARQGKGSRPGEGLKDLERDEQDVERAAEVSDRDGSGTGASGEGSLGSHTDGHDNPEGSDASGEKGYRSPKQNLRNYHKKPPEEKLAVPKPYGHTSMVHPFNGDRDREWYTEARWGPGQEYKPQDGPITELPRHNIPKHL